MTWEEAVAYCENHDCDECPAHGVWDCRSPYERAMLHYPCCMNLVDEKYRRLDEPEVSQIKAIIKDNPVIADMLRRTI